MDGGGGHGDEYRMILRTFDLIISQLLDVQNPPQPQNPNPNPDIQNSDRDPPPPQNPNPNPDIQNPDHGDDDEQSSSEPRLPAEFRASLASMGADNATLIFTRKLYDSDVDRGLNRLTIPRTQIKERFLRDDEEELLRQKDENGKVMRKLRVSVLDPKLNKWSLTLSRWKYHQSKNSGEGSCSYVLNGGWFDLVNENGLKRDTRIQLWSFRVNGSLGFVINVEDDEISDRMSTTMAVASDDDSGSGGDGGSGGVTVLPSWGAKKRRGSNAGPWRPWEY